MNTFCTGIGEMDLKPTNIPTCQAFPVAFQNWENLPFTLKAHASFVIVRFSRKVYEIILVL